MPFHRVYEEQYAVYFPLITAAEWIRREGEIRAERETQRRMDAETLDFKTPGYEQPEVEHALRAEKSEIEDFAESKYRFARDGERFSYGMSVAPADPVVLIATYWGGILHKRNFNILIDDEILATQELLLNELGEFFDLT